MPPENLKAREAPTMLYQHCVNMYDRMFEDAKPVEGMLVWEGMLTRLITREMNLSVPYYTSITKALKSMGCIRQLKRGGGVSPSQWELITEPTEMLFGLHGQGNPRNAKGTTHLGQLQYQMIQMEDRLKVLEDVLKGLIKEELGDQNG